MTSDYDHRRFGYGRIKGFEKDKQRGFILHERHIFLCYRNHGSWPADFVLGGPDSLPARLTSALKSREDQISRKTILTICEPSRDPKLEELKVGDVLIFPDMIKYRLNPSTVDSFITEVIVNNQIWSRSPMVPEFAANLIIFARDGKDEIDGHWYGYVSPEEVPAILSSHLVQGLVSHHRWRGKMGNRKILGLRAYPEWWWWRGDDGSIDEIEEDGVEMVGWDWLGPVPGVLESCKGKTPLCTRRGSLHRTPLCTLLYPPLPTEFEVGTFTQEELKAHFEEGRRWKLGEGRRHRSGY